MTQKTKLIVSTKRTTFMLSTFAFEVILKVSTCEQKRPSTHAPLFSGRACAPENNFYLRTMSTLHRPYVLRAIILYQTFVLRAIAYISAICYEDDNHVSAMCVQAS